MQSVQRQLGKFMKRSADDSLVAIILEDFNQVENVLAKIIESAKAWRDAWASLLTHQAQMLVEFEELYAPIPGSADAARKHAPTPEAILARTTKLSAECEDLKKDLMEELVAVDDRLINPASQAKESLLPFKKAIKKRDDRKLDYERYQGRVNNYSKKTKRSDRENASLIKAEDDLARATEDYHAADEHLRRHLPPLITAIFSLLPRLLAAQIGIQNSLLAHYYTMIYNYCQQEQFPSTPPPIDQAVTQWEQAHHPVRQEIESFACLANGKAVRSPQQSPTLPNWLTSQRRQSSNQQQRPTTSTSPALSAPAPSYDTKPVPVFNTKPKLGDPPTPSASSMLSVPSPYRLTPQLSASSPQSGATATSPSTLGYSSTPSSGLSSALPGQRTDYFSSRTTQQSPGRNGLTPASTSASPGVQSESAMSIAAKKKKPPPPPPRPPQSSSNLALFVTALYDFGGQGTGDLAFHQGDRIRVLKKTESTDDWWEGELRGVRGSFPANYVEYVE